MYPFIRLARARAAAQRAPRLPILGTHHSSHRCWPADLDMWGELNNGRTLTLYDLGRIPLLIRTGLSAGLAVEGWAFTVAGSSVRYRRRIVLWDRLEMRSRVLGWDGRFLYMDHSLWRQSEAAGQVLIRAAVVGPAGIIAPERAVRAAGHTVTSPALPRWVTAWAEAEALRPWPPESGPGEVG